MKKIFRSLLAIAIAATTFTACEDVPAPYNIPDSGSGNKEPDITTEAKGSGTLEDPFNSVAAINEAKKLASGAVSDKAYYIKGKVVSIATDKNGNVLNFDQGTFGNATFYISDDGTTTNQFYCYRVLYLGNKKWTQGAGDILKEGDEVIVCAKLTMYNTTPETQQNEGFLYSLNGKTEEGGDNPAEAKGNGTLEDPFNAVAATTEARKLASGAVSDKAYYIKGKVVSIATDKNGNVLNYDQGTFGNATFYISDDGTTTNQFYCYRVLYLGNKKWTQGAGDILKVGDEVIVCAKLTMYNSTPETQQNEGYLYSLNGKTESSGGDTPTPPTPSGENLMSNGDFETWDGGKPIGWASASTASNAKLSQSTDAHGGTYAVLVGGDASANKRLATTEMTLKAGSYTFTFYAKSTTDDAAQVRPGYVPVTDGKVGSYAYGDYASINNTGWTQVLHTFTLDATTTVCLVVMNPKTSNYATAQDVLIDDVTLTTSNGGLADGGNSGGDDVNPSAEVKAVTVGEFNAAEESTDVWYQLTGTVSHLEDGTYKNSTTYGNFDLTDDTGTVYVYGVLSEKGGAKAKFATLMKEKGIKDGSTITIIGNRGSYNGKIEVTNAYFVKVSN